MPTPRIAVVIPNLNGKKMLPVCLNSLLTQTLPSKIIVVDNGSRDGSAEFIADKYPEIILVRHQKNKGFAGGVNAGIRLAIDKNYDYVALFNNDAEADKAWLKNLVAAAEKNPKAGIITSKILDKGKRKLDSTGDFYTAWGLPNPRGRGEIDKGQYDNELEIFGASGGASLYRVSMLNEIGLFDEDFFAYYEDVDISFRAQLAGWKILYEPAAICYHAISHTSNRIPGFATYQTLKNLPQLFWKNVPAGLMPKIFPRFVILYFSILFSALARGQFGPVFKGVFMSMALWPKKLWQRRAIQSSRKVSNLYISSILVHDLPPNAHKLRRLRYFATLGRVR